jgi:hypothetical protein
MEQTKKNDSKLTKMKNGFTNVTGLYKQSGDTLLITAMGIFQFFNSVEFW